MSTKVDREIEAEESAFFDRYYREGAFHPVGNLLRQKREVRWLSRVLRGERIELALSLGCGDGQFETLLAPRVGRVIGVDLSAEAVAAARQRAARAGLTNVEFRQRSLAELDWLDRPNAVILLSFLHHLPASERSRTLERCHEILAPGGWLFTQDPRRGGLLRRLGRWILGKKYDTYHTPGEVELDAKETLAAIRAAGFEACRLGVLDSTLIPAMFLRPRGAAWPFYLCLAIDWLWARSPLAPWASAFTVVARKGDRTSPAPPI